jgi:hypothetical protein
MEFKISVGVKFTPNMVAIPESESYWICGNGYRLIESEGMEWPGRGG